MTEKPLEMNAFAISNDFIEEWLDSFDPSIKTFTANHVLNVMREYWDKDEEKFPADLRYFNQLLSQHFFALLKVKIREQLPAGYAPKEIYFPE